MKRIWMLCWIFGMVAILAGCHEKQEAMNQNAGNVSQEAEDEETLQQLNGEKSFVDGLGYEVTVTDMDRVAVCTGSLAHLWQLAGGSLVAVTDDVFEYEPVTLDEDTKNLGDIKRVNVEAILACDLDFIIMSATIKGHAKVRETLKQAGITTAYFEVETFDQYLEVLHTMTLLTGRDDLYRENGLEVKEEVEQQMKRKEESHPRILLLRALTTQMKVQNSENMTGTMLRDLGCENIADSKESLLESLSLEAILTEDPKFIFITVMGDEEQARQLIQKTIFEDAAWGQLSAVKEGRCYILQKNLFHNKPNQRWGESYRILADLLYGKEE